MKNLFIAYTTSDKETPPISHWSTLDFLLTDVTTVL